MKNLYDLIEEIRKRPAMYLGEKRISSLRTFLDGYGYALEEYDISTEEIPPLGVLHIWTANKFDWGPTSAGWNSILLKENQGDEAKALEHFFELLPEFRKVRPVWIGTVRITEANIAFCRKEETRQQTIYIDKDGNSTSIELIPDRIYLVAFSDQGGWHSYQIKEDKLLKLDWGFGDRFEAIGNLEKRFGKPTSLTEAAQSEVLSLFENIIKFC